MTDGVQDSVDSSVTENMSGTPSFEGTTPQHDPMKPIEAKPAPAGVPEKFWDADKGEVRMQDLLKSYGELETKLGQPKETAEETTEESTEEETSEDETEEATEDAEETTEEETSEDETEETEQAPLGDAITNAQAYFAEHGDLPADARKDLHALGISDDIINLQIEGAKAYQAGLEKAATEAAGVESYSDIQEAIDWAAKNWSEKKILAFNAQAGDIETVPLAVTALWKAYKGANPGEGQLLHTTPGANRGDVYGHKDEFARDLQAADAANDPVARRAAIAKQSRTISSRK